MSAAGCGRLLELKVTVADGEEGSMSSLSWLDLGCLVCGANKTTTMTTKDEYTSNWLEGSAMTKPANGRDTWREARTYLLEAIQLNSSREVVQKWLR